MSKNSLSLSENQICIQLHDVLDRLNQMNQLKCIYFHVPNEVSSNKSPIFGALLKKMGKKIGAPDYVFLWENGCGCIEMKKPKGKLSESQLSFKGECENKRVNYEVCYSSDEAIDVLIRWKQLEYNPF